MDFDPFAQFQDELRDAQPNADKAAPLPDVGEPNLFNLSPINSSPEMKSMIKTSIDNPSVTSSPCSVMGNANERTAHSLSDNIKGFNGGTLDLMTINNLGMRGETKSMSHNDTGHQLQENQWGQHNGNESLLPQTERGNMHWDVGAGGNPDFSNTNEKINDIANNVLVPSIAASNQYTEVIPPVLDSAFGSLSVTASSSNSSSHVADAPLGSSLATELRTPDVAPSNVSDNDDIFGIFSCPQPSNVNTHISGDGSFSTPSPQVPDAPVEPSFATEVRSTDLAPSNVSGDDDFFGFFSNAPLPSEVPATEHAEVTSKTSGDSTECPLDSEYGLPLEGKFYEIKIEDPSIGLIFYSAQKLKGSLFLKADKQVVSALGDRPVVSHTNEDGSAQQAGVQIGHVLLKVNETNVKTVHEARQSLLTSSRPLKMLFYIPNATVDIAEGMCMVKYDTRAIAAPNYTTEWKPKYVVVGRKKIFMYRSKSEYDQAVREQIAKRPISVKVKTFNLYANCKIVHDTYDPEKTVEYEDEEWKYMVIVRPSRLPVKIASTQPDGLKPVLEGIRRLLKSVESS